MPLAAGVPSPLACSAVVVDGRLLVLASGDSRPSEEDESREPDSRGMRGRSCAVLGLTIGIDADSEVVEDSGMMNGDEARVFFVMVSEVGLMMSECTERYEDPLWRPGMLAAPQQDALKYDLAYSDLNTRFPVGRAPCSLLRRPATVGKLGMRARKASECI